MQCPIQEPVVDLGGGCSQHAPPTDQHFFNFMGFFRKYTNILGRCPTKRLVSPPMTSTGSAPGNITYIQTGTEKLQLDLNGPFSVSAHMNVMILNGKLHMNKQQKQV